MTSGRVPIAGRSLDIALGVIPLLSTIVVSPAHTDAAAQVSLGRLGAAIVINGLAAALGWGANTVTGPGAVVGGAIGVVIFAASGWQGWSLLVAAFVTATLASRLGWRRKHRLGIAEARGGRRGPANALANTGLAALAAVVGAATPWSQYAALAFAAALIAGASDTVASEVGKAWGRPTWLITSLARVRPGTSGAISLAGTVAGLLSAMTLAVLGSALGVVPSWAVWIVVLAATSGIFFESLLGATAEVSDLVDNDLLNLLNTACAAAVAVGLTGLRG